MGLREPLLLREPRHAEDADLRWQWTGALPKDALTSLAWKPHSVKWVSIRHDMIYSLNQRPFCDAVSPVGRQHGFGNKEE